jgi:hypothetical protein
MKTPPGLRLLFAAAGASPCLAPSGGLQPPMAQRSGGVGGGPIGPALVRRRERPVRAALTPLQKVFTRSLPHKIVTSQDRSGEDFLFCFKAPGFGLGASACGCGAGPRPGAEVGQTRGSLGRSRSGAVGASRHYLSSYSPPAVASTEVVYGRQVVGV